MRKQGGRGSLGTVSIGQDTIGFSSLVNNMYSIASEKDYCKELPVKIDKDCLVPEKDTVGEALQQISVEEFMNMLFGAVTVDNVDNDESDEQ